jgi:hypothetical protein
VEQPAHAPSWYTVKGHSQWGCPFLQPSYTGFCMQDKYESESMIAGIGVGAEPWDVQMPEASRRRC